MSVTSVVSALQVVVDLQDPLDLLAALVTSVALDLLVVLASPVASVIQVVSAI